MPVQHIEEQHPKMDCALKECRITDVYEHQLREHYALSAVHPTCKVLNCDKGFFNAVELGVVSILYYLFVAVFRICNFFGGVASGFCARGADLRYLQEDIRIGGYAGRALEGVATAYGLFAL